MALINLANKLTLNEQKEPDVTLGLAGPCLVAGRPAGCSV